jgi:hypothetical protein
MLATLWDDRGDRIDLDYRQNRDAEGRTTLSEIDGRLWLKLWGGSSVQFRSNYSFERDEDLETEFILHIQRQCWGVSFGYVEEPDDQRFMVGFTLHGIGALGPQLRGSRD